MHIIWLEREYLMPEAIRAMHPVQVLLDIGCGIVPQNYVLPQTHICCEPYPEYVDVLQNKISNLEVCDRNYIIINMGWKEVVSYFPEKSVDSIFLLDVIEHLEKEEGLNLLAKTEKIARQQVIIFTPLGFMPQHHSDGKDAWGLSGGGWQEHKSGWFPEDFIGEEWKCFVAKDYHTVDSHGNTLYPPYGALWAIKTYASNINIPILKDIGYHNREVALLEREAELGHHLKKIQNDLDSLIFGRMELKIRRFFKFATIKK